MSERSVQDVTLAIIAGGAGKRMGGAKHRLVLGSMPILGALLDRVRWPGPVMLVVGADRARVEGQERCDVVVADAVGGEGPLRGVLTALEACGTEAMAAAPIDMPGLQCEHMEWLADAGMSDSGAACVLLRRPSEGRTRIEPFPGFYRRVCAEPIRGMLAAGERALHRLAELPGTRVVDAPGAWDDSVWTNLNTPQDLETFTRGEAMRLETRP